MGTYSQIASRSGCASSGVLVRARLGDRSRVRALIKAAADSLGVKVAVSAGYGDWGEGDGAHGPERDGADYFEVTVTG